MKNESKHWISLKAFAMIVVGCVLFALAFALFLEPNLITTGGVSGLAMAISHLSSWPMGVLIVALNVPLMALALWKFGIRFIASTLFATVLSSVLLDLGLSFLPCMSNDLLLASLYGGLLLGAGMGLVLLGGATTGGSDILSKLVTLKYPHMKLGRVMLVIDVFVIVICAAVFRNINLALYAAITLYVSSVVIDAIIYGADKAVLSYVITDHAVAIGTRIQEELERGVTYLQGMGGYSMADKRVILCAVRRDETNAFQAIVHEIDPDAFVILSEAHNVFGLGFSPFKKH